METNPVKYLFERQEKIIEIIKDKYFNLEHSWTEINLVFPEIVDVMNYKGFENYIGYLPLIEAETRKYREKNEKLLLEIKKIKKRLHGNESSLQDSNLKVKELQLDNIKLKQEICKDVRDTFLVRCLLSL